MPIYEYECDDCRIPEEHLQSSTARAPKCPKCGEKMTKLIGLTNFRLYGEGYYKPTPKTE